MGLERLWDISNAKGSRIILALDYGGKFGYEGLLNVLKEYVAGVKLGFPLLLEIGLRGLKDIIKRFSSEYFFIADFKIGDIPSVCRIIAGKLKEFGFEAAIAHAIVGPESLKAISENISLIALVSMSHPGSTLINMHVDELVRMALNSGAQGLVAPATFPKILTRVRRLAPEITIISPGVGIQGAPYGAALRAGADFEICGRSITLAEDPPTIAKGIMKLQKEAIKK